MEGAAEGVGEGPARRRTHRTLPSLEIKGCSIRSTPVLSLLEMEGPTVTP
jgi:hypothetical protein